MDTVGSGGQGNVGSAIDQDPALCIPGKRYGTGGQIKQFPVCEILFPNLDEIDRETEKHPNPVQQGLSG